MLRVHPCRFGLLLSLLTASGAGIADIPANEPPLNQTLNSANGLYQLRYTDNIYSTNYMPTSQVQASANALDRSGTAQVGFPLGYHDGYVDLGFRTPYFEGGVRDVTFWDCKDPADPDAFDCDNGFAVLEQIVMPAPTYRNRSESCLRMILGHELFHHVEFAHVNAGGGEGCGSVFGTTVCEGQARAMQDKVYFDLDLAPGASCIASFRGEANLYLGSPDLDILKSSYTSALFWTYLMEQYGTFNTEPYRGADFLTAWWDLAEDRVANPDIADITQQAIKLFEPNDTFINAYQDFTITNLMKDLSLLGLPVAAQARYQYIDEQPVLGQNNQMSFDAVALSDTATVAANQTVQRSFDAQRLGADYIRFDVSACPAGSTMAFDVAPDPGASNPTPGAQALISLLLTKAPSVPIRLWKWRASSAKASAVQAVGTPYQYAYVIASGRNGHYAGRATVQCKPAPLAPVLKFAGKQAQPGPGVNPIGTIKVQVPDGSTPGQMLAGLAGSDFQLQVGGVNATIETALPDGDGYLLRFRHPAQSTPGPFPVAVQVGGQTTSLANAIRYDQPEPELIMVLDLTQSMQTTGLLLPAIQKVREAAARMRSTARFGLIGFAGNGNEPGLDATVLLPLAPLNSAQRASLESALSTLSASTSSVGAPGDGVQAAIDEFTARGGNGPKSVVLISDGGIGEGSSVATLEANLAAQRIAVHAVALGPQTNQGFYDLLGKTSSGSYHYVPTDATGPNAAAFDLAIDSSAAAATREHILLARQVAVPTGTTVDHSIHLEGSVLGSSGAVVFAIETAVSAALPPSSIRLFRPSGQEVVASAQVEIVDSPRGRYFRVDDAGNGNWNLRLSPNGAGGASAIDLKVLMAESRLPGLVPALARARSGSGALRTGEALAIIADLQSANTDDASHMGPATATLELPSGGSVLTRMQYRAKRAEATFTGDDAPARAMAEFDALREGWPAGLPDDATTGGVRGSYRLVFDVEFGGGAAPYHLRSTRSLVVHTDTTDADVDGLPDLWELDRSCALDAATGSSADPDQDGLDNASERAQGTDPCAADTDEGGEPDGSEVQFGRSPLVDGDDAFSGQPSLAIDNEFSQHEEMPVLPPNSLPLRYDVDARAGHVKVFSGVDVQGPYQLLATLNGSNLTGQYLHTGLNLGQRYCYRVQAGLSNGASGLMSEPVCATVRADMRAPTGMITLADGANQSSAGVVTAHLDLDHESPIGAAMRLRLHDGSMTGWLMFQSTFTINISSVPRPSTIRVDAQFRDADGNTSPWYADELDLIDAGTVAVVRGSFRGGVNVAAGDVNVRAMAETQIPPQTSAVNGDFQLRDLPPGTYQLEFSHPQYQTQTRTVTVGPGTDLDLGEIMLTPIPSTVFADSFE